MLDYEAKVLGAIYNMTNHNQNGGKSGKTESNNTSDHEGSGESEEYG